MTADSTIGIDCEFATAVRDLYVPTMGTEVMAPLLYSLIRFVRARSVLEAGMGYTTPFIARALRDNDENFRREKAGLIEKTVRYVSELDGMGEAARVAANGPEGRGLAAVYAPKTSTLADRRTQWMFADPAALMNPQYYLDDTLRSQLVCVDNIGSTSSSARRVKAAIETLGLSNYVSEHVGDFWSFDFPTLAKDSLPFDVIWLDLPVSVRNVMSLLDGNHWKLLNPNGGLLIIHDMLTHEGGQILVKELFQAEQQKRFDEFEFVSLLEPHRVVQNSFVMIRKRTGYQDVQIEKQFTSPDESGFEESARALLRGQRGDAQR